MLRFIFWTISLLAVLLAASCAPAPAVSPPPAAATQIPPSAVETATLTATRPTVPPDAPTASPPAVATSRGPNLEATDPATVQLASGGLQLVEFFRFT